MGKPKITKEKANEIVLKRGYFFGLGQIVNEYELSKELEARIEADLYRHLLIKIREAAREITRLQATVARLETACAAGAKPPRVANAQVSSQQYYRLANEMRAFDGWTISLLETSITLLALIINPETAGNRVLNLERNFANLWQKRLFEGWGPLDSSPDIFPLPLVFGQNAVNVK